jgi:demethylmenaquinone methyltransferase/2-methoxy-6-polyprenyl-1,4-benzoquinol methylase
MRNCYDELEPNIYRKIARKIQNVAPILDVGCGDGRLVNFLALKLGKKVFGVDVSDAGFERGRREAKLKNISHLIDYVKTDASHLDMFGDKFLGGVISVYTLHEFEEPSVALREMRRVLKTGGRLVIVDFIRGGEAERLWGERYYKPAEIESMLEDAGFREARTGFLYKDVALVSALKI